MNNTKTLTVAAVMAVALTAFGLFLRNGVVRAESGSPSEQVAALQALDRHEIEAGDAVRQRNVPEPVKEFAQMMVEHHMRNLEDTNTLVHQAGIPVDETGAVKSLDKRGDARLESLKKIEDDAEFARTYMKEMIAGHEDALKQLDAFIQRSDVRLKEHFIKTRMAVAAHLEKARAVSAGLR